MAYSLYRSPDGSRVVGIEVLIGSFLSFFGGGGFYLGLLFGVVGAIAAIRFEPSVSTDLDLGDL